MSNPVFAACGVELLGEFTGSRQQMIEAIEIGARKEFTENGDVAPTAWMVLGINPETRQRSRDGVFVCLRPFLERGEYTRKSKRMFETAQRQMAEQLEARAVANVSEAWTVREVMPKHVKHDEFISRIDQHIDDHGSLEDFPGRREIVVVVVEWAKHSTIHSEAEIVERDGKRLLTEYDRREPLMEEGNGRNILPLTAHGKVVDA